MFESHCRNNPKSPHDKMTWYALLCHIKKIFDNVGNKKIQGLHIFTIIVIVLCSLWSQHSFVHTCQENGFVFIVFYYSFYLLINVYLLTCVSLFCSLFAMMYTSLDTLLATCVITFKPLLLANQIQMSSFECQPKLQYLRIDIYRLPRMRLTDYHQGLTF